MQTITTIGIQIIKANDHAAPGKLADAAFHCSGGKFDGLKLVGLAVWKRRDVDGLRCREPRSADDRRRGRADAGRRNPGQRGPRSPRRDGCPDRRFAVRIAPPLKSVASAFVTAEPRRDGSESRRCAERVGRSPKTSCAPHVSTCVHQHLVELPRCVAVVARQDVTVDIERG
jgi:hypothetical protein